MLATAIGFVPIVGDAIDIIGAVAGEDLLTGENISGVGVLATAAGTIFLGSGRLTREGTDVVRRFLDDPDDFERVGAFIEEATSKRAKGGVSIQEIFENAEGERIIRHTVIDAKGRIVDGPHPRPIFKPRQGDVPDEP